jgi:hypothetical protein
MSVGLGFCILFNHPRHRAWWPSRLRPLGCPRLQRSISGFDPGYPTVSTKPQNVGRPFLSYAKKKNVSRLTKSQDF